MRQRPLAPLIAVVVIVVGLFIITLGVGNKPNLGLDLQGGVSVVLKPVVKGKSTESVPKESLEQTKAIIDKRVNGIGVGEPDITIQGSTIVVQLPGIKDQQRALTLVGKTAELRFRPVLQITGTIRSAAQRTTDKAREALLRKELKVPEGTSAVQIAQEEDAARHPTTTAAPNAPTTTVAPGPQTTTTAASTTTAAPTTTAAAGAGTGGSRSAKGRRQTATTTEAPTTTVANSDAPATTTTSTTIDPTPKNAAGVQVYTDSKATVNKKFQELLGLEQQDAAEKAGLTTTAKDVAGQPVTLADKSPTIDPKTKKDLGRSVYSLGPTLLTGSAVEDATAGVANGVWQVNPKFREGPKGIDEFNAAGAKCFAKDAQICPSGRLAIVLDGQVISAPSINSASFARDQIQITGSFDEVSANDLALSLRYGSLPLTLEPQQVETVSATLGKGALHAGLIAGGVGLLLVALYILMYYRLLGVVTLGSLIMSSMTLWVIIAFLGSTQGLTLTLSGIVGIVVSIGVSLDSSVVYYENLKEDVRGGRTMRTAVDRSFTHAYSTMVKADLSSLIGAVILYVLSVGPVRGFAFFLGLSTILDLVFAYFFMRPAVAALGRSKLGRTPAKFGIPLDDAMATPPVLETANQGAED